MSITLNSALISNLNELQCLPLPVSKLLVVAGLSRLTKLSNLSSTHPTASASKHSTA